MVRGSWGIEHPFYASLKQCVLYFGGVPLLNSLLELSLCPNEIGPIVVT